MNTNMCITTSIILELIIVSVTFTVTAGSSAERRLEALYRHLSADVEKLEEKIWVDVALEIEGLKERLTEETAKRDALENQLKKVLEKSTLTTTERQDQLLEHSDADACTCGNMKNKLNVMRNGFKSEKLLSKNRDNDVATIAGSLSTLSVSINNTARDLQNITGAIVDEVNSISDSVSEVRRLVDSVQQMTINRIGNLSNMVMMTECKRQFDEPYFISPWKQIASQNDNLSEIIVEHGLGAIPLKVDVQLKPTSGPNADWVFPGDSALQSDDDINTAYGGVVYFYNETHVHLLAPKQVNNYDTGRVINTGNSKSYWIGEDHQTAQTAFVRVRVWGGDNMPPPDHQTKWLPLNISRKELAFYEIDHGLCGYPALVSVQIRVNNSERGILLSDGMGSVMTPPRNFDNIGGVVHAFNDRAVRIWSPYRTETEGGHISGKLIGTPDGWGSHGWQCGWQNDIGEVRVSAWSQKSLDWQEHVLNAADGRAGSSSCVDLSRDLLSCYVQASTGVNKGFRFRGWGGSQSAGTPYGGLVYAYDDRGRVKMWQPNPATGGHLVHVASPIGAGNCTQSSNTAVLVVTDIKSGKRRVCNQGG